MMKQVSVKMWFSIGKAKHSKYPHYMAIFIYTQTSYNCRFESVLVFFSFLPKLKYIFQAICMLTCLKVHKVISDLYFFLCSFF